MLCCRFGQCIIRPRHKRQVNCTVIMTFILNPAWRAGNSNS